MNQPDGIDEISKEQLRINKIYTSIITRELKMPLSEALKNFCKALEHSTDRLSFDLLLQTLKSVDSEMTDDDYFAVSAGIVGKGDKFTSGAGFVAVLKSNKAAGDKLVDYAKKQAKRLSANPAYAEKCAEILERCKLYSKKSMEITLALKAVELNKELDRLKGKKFGR